MLVAPEHHVGGPAVLTVGYPACQLPVRDGGAAPVVEASGTDVGRLIDAVLSGIESAGSVVAIHPTWADEPARRNLQAVRSALMTDRLVIWPISLPPLAGAVLASVASVVSPHVASSGELVSALPAFSQQLLSATWLRSVASLREPSPTLGMHLASYLPRSAFAVCSWSDPPVRRLRDRDRGLPPPPVDGRRMAVAIASRDGDVGWVREVVVPALGRPPVVEVPPTPTGPEWWGTSQLVEAVAYPLEVSELLAAARRQIGLVCRWCGEKIASPPCPFCWMGTADPRAPVPVSR